MSSSPHVFDTRLARMRAGRAHRAGFAAFLIDHAAADLRDRLDAVLRPFLLALDLGTPTDAAMRALTGSGRVGRLVRAAASGPGASVICDAEALPFAPGTFDLAVSLLAFHMANDLPGLLVQLRRSLAPDGLFIGCMLGGQSLSELRQAFLAAETEIEGGASPRVAPFADMRDLGSLLQRAGFALPVIDSDVLTVRYDTMFGLMHDLRAMGWSNALIARRKTPLRRATLLRAAAIYAERFADADGRVRATFEIVWLSGWAPHESQQKPLAPGSAKTRLADALGTIEIGTGDRAGG